VPDADGSVVSLEGGDEQVNQRAANGALVRTLPIEMQTRGIARPLLTRGLDGFLYVTDQGGQNSLPRLRRFTSAGETVAGVTLALRYSESAPFKRPNSLAGAADGRSYALIEGTTPGQYLVELDPTLRPIRRWLVPGPATATNDNRLLITSDGTLYLRNGDTYRLIP
jgi:hypothetical protein